MQRSRSDLFFIGRYTVGTRNASTERGGYNFVDTAKIDRGVAVRKPERRQGRRLLCRRHSGRNSDQAGEHRRLESDFAHFHGEVQEQTGRSEDSFATARRRDGAGRQRAKGGR